MSSCCPDHSHDPIDRRLRTVAILRTIYKSHLLIYLIVIAFLFVVNFLTTPGRWWVLWPAAGWGLALVIHGVFTYGFNPGVMEEKEYQKLKEKYNSEKK